MVCMLFACCVSTSCPAYSFVFSFILVFNGIRFHYLISYILSFHPHMKRKDIEREQEWHKCKHGLAIPHIAVRRTLPLNSIPLNFIAPTANSHSCFLDSSTSVRTTAPLSLSSLSSSLSSSSSPSSHSFFPFFLSVLCLCTQNKHSGCWFDFPPSRYV